MKNQCGWIALAGTSPGRDHLKGPEKADWLIIGAGITGLSAAHSLAEMYPEARIVVVDRQRAAQGPQRATPATRCPTKTPAMMS